MKVLKTLQATGWLGLALMLTQCRADETFYSNVMRSDVFYQLYASDNFDFLWVFDNSGSMVTRRQYVRDNMQNFINILNSRKAVNYQMAVTTTDMFTHGGALVNGGGVDVVKSATSPNPVAQMASIIDAVQDSFTSFWEQGLESAYQAITLHKSEFSRYGVPLIVIMLTDENDFSCQDNCFGVEPENNVNWIPFPTTRYSDFFKNVKANEETGVHVFPIVGRDSSNCMVASVGSRYEDVSDDVGGLGLSGSICSSELPAAYEAIARTLSDRGIRFPLTSQASGNGISVYVNQILIPYSADNGWTFEQSSNSIVFTGNAVPANGSVIEVTYNQKSN